MARVAYNAGSFGGALTISPQAGMSFTVTITGGPVTSDAAGTTTVTFPQTVTSSTTYYSPENGPLTLSCLWNSVETANGNAGTYSWTPKDGQAVTITPAPTLLQDETNGSATSGKTVSTVAYAATVTPAVTAGSDLILNIGALTGALTLANPTGSPNDGDKLYVRFVQDGTGGRAITYGTAFAFGTDVTASLDPTTANAKWTRLFMWNAADSKWWALSIARGF